jgi:hypothetical protein
MAFFHVGFPCRRVLGMVRARERLKGYNVTALATFLYEIAAIFNNGSQAMGFFAGLKWAHKGIATQADIMALAATHHRQKPTFSTCGYHTDLEALPIGKSA